MRIWRIRSSRQRCSIQTVVLRNSAKFTRKQLCLSLFLNKVAGLRPATLLKKRLWLGDFPVNFTKFLRRHLLATVFEEFLYYLLCNMRLQMLIFEVCFFCLFQYIQYKNFKTFNYKGLLSPKQEAYMSNDWCHLESLGFRTLKADFH